MKGDNLMKTLLIAVLFSTMLFLQPSIADEMPPNNAKLLSEVIRTLEDKGYSPFVAIEFEDGSWEIEVYKAGVKRELRVDPISGEIISDQKYD
jgi:hypothetical protein